jgi:hypothetical protein
MKRLALLLVAGLVLVTACAAQPADVDVVYSGMVPRVVEWNETTLDVDGNPVNGPMSYEIYVCLQSDHSDAVLISEVTEETGTVDVSAMQSGYYYVGVRPIDHDVEGNPVPSENIGWSNEAAAVDPTGRFAYRVVSPPLSATGLLTLP